VNDHSEDWELRSSLECRLIGREVLPGFLSGSLREKPCSDDERSLYDCLRQMFPRLYYYCQGRRWTTGAWRTSPSRRFKRRGVIDEDLRHDELRDEEVDE